MSAREMTERHANAWTRMIWTRVKLSIATLWSRLLGGTSAIAIDGSAPLAVVLPERPRAKRQKRNVDKTTKWIFKTTILDRLEEYFVCMRKLKKHDPDSYDLFSQVGCAVPSDKWVARKRPNVQTSIGFGGVSFPSDSLDDDMVCPSFVYFRKKDGTKISPIVQPFHGSVYEVTAVYDDRRRARRWRTTLALPVSFHVGVNPDGSLLLLREFSQTSQVVNPRARRGHKRMPFTVHHTQWRYPSWMLNDERGRSPLEIAEFLFVMAYDTYIDSMSAIRISVEWRGLTATFGIDLDRAPYFFADRDNTAVAPDGTKKKIFHYVRSHERKIGDERTTEVKAHYRGIRQFEWNGYTIRITMPNVSSGLLLGDFPASFDVDGVPDMDKSDILYSKQVGEIVRDRLEAAS